MNNFIKMVTSLSPREMLLIVLIFLALVSLSAISKDVLRGVPPEMAKSPIDEVIETGKPVVRPLLPDQKFTLMEDPVRLGNLQIGKVKVRRESDGYITFFSSLLSHKKGEVVKISRVWYQECQNGDVTNFCFVN